MIRRWSYINSVNNSHMANYDIGRKSAFDVNMNSTMYLHRDYALSTHIPRHRWARRKHLYNWIQLANIMKDWAKVYRFYRKYTKFITNQYFTKNSLTAFNLVSSFNSIPCLFKGSEDVVAAPVTRKVLRYFSHMQNPRLTFFISNTHTARTLISYDPKYWDLKDLPEKPSFVPLFNDNLNSFTSCESSTTESSIVSQNTTLNLIIWPFVMSLLKTKSIYRTSVLITYLRLKM